MQAFGDGFDLYNTIADLFSGYWDSGLPSNGSLVTGRFAGSRAYVPQYNIYAAYATKASGANDAVHHLVFAINMQGGPLSGTNNGFAFQLIDGTTTQCTLQFRGDGAMLLYSGAAPNSGGTALATYATAVTSATAWFAFEVEIVINNTTGSITVRKNGNTGTPDFQATGLNTRSSTNNYANKLSIWQTYNTGYPTAIDDFLWRSDPTSVPWVGDIRCYTRMPASDAQKQWSNNPVSVTPYTTATSVVNVVPGARLGTFTAPVDGTIGSVILSENAGYTGNMKASVFASLANQPTTVLGSTTNIVNPVTGTNTFVFTTPAAVAKGSQYWVGFSSDTSAAGAFNTPGGSAGWWVTTPYASFPAASPSVAATAPPVFTAVITPTGNYTLVNEPQQDGTTSYAFDSNPGDNDLYAIGSTATPPQSTVCVTTRGFFEKSDAGTRGATVQLKSGTTTVQGTSSTLGTTFGWLWRTDLNDPNTSAAWTATAVNNAQIGPVVTA